MEEEIYKPIVGHDNYEVSNLGNIRYKKDGVYRPGYTFISKKGYLRVTMRPNGAKLKKYAVHRLVAQVWIPNPENKPQVNHIDGNKLNNRVDNLEWNTSSENVVHAFNNNLRQDCINGTITDIDTKEVHNFISINQMAKFLDVPSNGILQFVERSKVLPIRFKYILDVKLEDAKDNYNIKPIIVYDYNKKETKVFKSYNEAVLYTGVPSSTFAKELKHKDAYYIAGYTYSYKDITPLDITPEQAMVDRLKIYTKPIISVSQSIELYNYDTQEVITCIERNDVINYIDTSLSCINTAINRVHAHKRTWLLGGYGIRRVNQKYPWYQYSKSEILCNKKGLRFDTPIYRLNVEGREEELVYGAIRAMRISNLVRSTFAKKVVNSKEGYNFEIDSLKANIRNY